MSITVENERPEEYRTVEELIRAAFLNVNVLGCVEHYTAHVLHSHEDFIPELDFVLRACLVSRHAHLTCIFSATLRQFFLKYIQYSCEKLPSFGEKSAA